MLGLSSIGIKKEANYNTAKQAAGMVVPIVGAAVALKGINAFIDTVSNKMDKRKFNGVIDYAKNKHPELKKVPQQDMKEWMNSFYTLSPSIATNKELGASMLSTVHDYGGNIDMATAKIIAETGNKAGAKHNESELLNYISTGRSITPSHHAGLSHAEVN